MDTTFYDAGTASIDNGATTITFSVGSLADGIFRAGDSFVDLAQPLVPPQRLASAPVAGVAELAVAWPGTSLVSAAYEVRFTSDGVRQSERTRQLIEEMSVVEANGRGLFYRFSDSVTDADPGSGYVRLNNVTIGSATAGYLDNLDANGASVGAVLDSWDDHATAASRGQLWLRSIADPSSFHAFQVSGSVVDGTGYRKLTLAYIGGSGSFAADDELMVMFSAQGADGTNAILGVWQGAWVTATAYDVDDLVEQDGSTYICIEAHTSGTFATDLAAAKWDLAVEKGDTGDDSTVPGPTGPKGVNWQGTYSGATAYVEDDGVLYNGSSWRALGATTGNAPPTLPTTSNTWWELIARAGTDGAGTVASVAAGTGIAVDNTDPTAPEVSVVAFTGDSGAGGALGGVPAPAAGDAAANKFLKADGTWSVVAAAPERLPTLSNNVTDATNDIDFAAGSAWDSTDAVKIVCPAMTKRLDANWAAGTGNGGRNSGAAIANTMYRCYAVSKAGGADPDFYFHTSDTVATVLTALQAETGGADYVNARRIGNIVRASNAIRLFRQTGDHFNYAVPIAETDVAISTSRSLVTITAPPHTTAKMRAAAYHVDPNTLVVITPTSETDAAVTGGAASPGVSVVTQASNVNVAAPSFIEVDASSQIAVRSSASSTQFRVVTWGYVDTRGRF